jgi:hypothetical protein
MEWGGTLDGGVGKKKKGVSNKKLTQGPNRVRFAKQKNYKYCSRQARREEKDLRRPLTRNR